ncbi:protein kinase [Nocardia sp. NPDC051030]|uniref:protein kinase domain-containing protein n=1 Tax=Nocardia sp. NPDC051030 TaxID=3155162 RepID=UPI00341FD6A0
MEGTSFGQYRLRALIGEGGMGQVYEAYDTDTDRVVALKVLPPHSAADPTFRERFRRESRAAAALNEPHVIPIHRYGEIDGRLYLDMRLVRGSGLDAVIRRHGPMAPGTAVSIIGQVASALTAAHTHGLVHRDVKPSNMLVCADDFVYLIDFGIARSISDSGLTSAGATVGTFAYLSPERLGDGRADARSDVYALTCVLHECLTGTQPYPSTSLEQQITAHLTSPPPRPSTVRPGVPAAFDDVIAHGMAKDPEQRYQSAADLAAAARRALTGEIPTVRAELAGAEQVADDSAPTIVNTMPAPGEPDPEPLTVRATVSEPVPDRETVRSDYLPNPVSPGNAAGATAGPGPGATRFRRAYLVIAALAMVIALVAAGIWYATTRPKPLADPKVTATIEIGLRPKAIAVDPDNHIAYATNSGDGTVSIIDTTANTLYSNLDVGKGPQGVAIDPTTQTAYVVNGDELSVSVIETRSNTVTSTLPLGFPLEGSKNSQALAVDPVTHTAYVVNTGDGTVSVLDTSARSVITTVKVGVSPQGVAVDSATHTAYVTNGDRSITVIDTASRKVTTTFPIDNLPRGIVVDSAARIAYVTHAEDRLVSIIDLDSNSVVTTIEVGNGPQGIALDPVIDRVYVANNDDGTVSVINTESRTVTATVAVGNGPQGVAVDDRNHIAYVTNSIDGSVSVIEP